LRTLTTFTALTAFTAAATISTATISAIAFARGKWRLRGSFLLSFKCLASFTRQYIALINPYFDADDTEGGMGLCQPIINIGSQGVQGNLPLDLFLGASNFCSTKAAAADNSDALSARAHRFLHCLLHSTAK